MNTDRRSFTLSEWMICIILYFALSVYAAWLFYDSFAAALVFSPLFFLFLRAVRSYRSKKRRHELADGFLRCLLSVSSSLSAGISAENAFVAAASDMEKLYGPRADIVRQLRLVNSQVEMGRRLETALLDLAKRSGIQEIYDFAVVFMVAKEKGANMPEVISNCTQLMEDRQASENEARVLIRAKQYEQRVMCVIPPGIITYLKFSSGGFMGVLYHNVTGIAVMTTCLFVYVFAIYLAERIGDVAV